jgi:hypothetical protein
VSIETVNCTELSAEVNGEPAQQVRPEILATRLATLTRATLRLRLINVAASVGQPVIQEYRIMVLSPDEDSLEEVDSLFLTSLAVEDIKLQDVGQFYESTRDGSAAEYAEALADYVRGVLLKDDDPRTGISAQFHHYHEVQKSSTQYPSEIRQATCGAAVFCPAVRPQ